MPSDKFLIWRCPTGFTYGSSCSFYCSMSYILKGNESVSCELDNSGKHGIWVWTNDTESFCEKLSRFISNFQHICTIIVYFTSQ